MSEIIDPIQMLPAPGQGALAVEVRSDDAELIAHLAGLDDPDTSAAVRAERAVLAALEAGCSSPIGALAEVVEGDDGPELSLRAVVAAPDGSDALRRSIVGPVGAAESLGARLAAVLVEDGALDLDPSTVSPIGRSEQRPRHWRQCASHHCKRPNERLPRSVSRDFRAPQLDAQDRPADRDGQFRRSRPR